MYEAISQEDVRRAADEFRPVYEKTGGVDGYVSLEVKSLSGPRYGGDA
jgi:transaldolase